LKFANRIAISCISIVEYQKKSLRHKQCILKHLGYITINELL
jgi:hypothetical protein